MRSVRTSGGKRSEGIVLLRGGNPEASLHQRDGAQDRGRVALKKVWQDSYDESCILELHARVDMEGLVREYANAFLERPAKVMKRARVPSIERGEVEKQIRIWKERGYDASSVESSLDAEPGLLTAAVIAMREAVKKAEAASEILAGLDVSGFESRASILHEKLRDPIRHPDLDVEVENLRDLVESARRSEARRKIETARERDSQERTKKLLDLVLKRRPTPKPPAPVAAAPAMEAATKALVEAPPPRDDATNLVPGFTFEGFTVGESNKFAHSAAVTVAKDPAKAYNPLLITSGPGLGKTHLLHAIGNYIASHKDGASVLYLTCEAFASRFAEAREQGSLAAFRERVRGVECLLIDDIQFLSSMPAIHEELFHAFNELQQSQRQVVLASDRPPKAIPNLDDRLVSRFESGLVAGIEPPDLTTRIAILDRRTRETKVAMDSTVLSYIATLVEDNVRELGGAFNRVVAFSSMMGRPITEDLAREVLAKPFVGPTPPPVAEPSVVSSVAPLATATLLVPGHSYLVEEDRPVEAFRRFAAFLQGGGSGLVISRTNPRRARELHDLAAQRLLWLTDREGSAEDTIPPALERIVYEIEGFISKQPRGAVLLDGIEYLVSNNSFEAVLKFVRRLLDSFSESRYVFIISLGPATLKEQELKVLEREMDVIRASA